MNRIEQFLPLNFTPAIHVSYITHQPHLPVDLSRLSSKWSLSKFRRREEAAEDRKTSGQEVCERTGRKFAPGGFLSRSVLGDDLLRVCVGHQMAWAGICM